MVQEISGSSNFNFRLEGVSNSAPSGFGSLSQGNMDQLFGNYATLKEWYFNPSTFSNPQMETQVSQMQQSLKQLLEGMPPSNPYYQNIENAESSVTNILNDLQSGNPTAAKKEIAAMLTSGNTNLSDLLSAWSGANGSFDITPLTGLEMVDFETSEGHTSSAISNLQGLISYLNCQGKDTSQLQKALAALQQTPPDTNTVHNIIEQQISNLL